MLVTMKNSELIDQLVTIANGDIELVQRAISESANGDGAADLEQVVQYIIANRHSSAESAAA